MKIKEFLATRVQPGEVVILRASAPLSFQQVQDISANLRAAFLECGVNFVLLDNQFEIAGIQAANEATP